MATDRKGDTYTMTKELQVELKKLNRQIDEIKRQKEKLKEEYGVNATGQEGYLRQRKKEILIAHNLTEGSDNFCMYRGEINSLVRVLQNNSNMPKLSKDEPIYVERYLDIFDTIASACETIIDKYV